jgi:vancomycin permeability regulator SanA
VLIVSGGKGGDEQVSEAGAMAGYLAARGFPADRLQREDRSASTRENLACSRVIMDRLRPGPSCVIVTSNFHVFRAAMIARRLGVRGLPQLQGGQRRGLRAAGCGPGSRWPCCTTPGPRIRRRVTYQG